MSSEELRDAPVSRIRDLLVAQAPADMAPGALRVLREEMLVALRESRCRYAVLDCSNVEVMDTADAETLRRTLACAALMGAVPVISGLRPGVAATLAGHDGKLLAGIRIVRDLDEALRLT